MTRTALLALGIAWPLLGIQAARADSCACGHSHHHHHHKQESRVRKAWKHFRDGYREAHNWPDPYRLQAYDAVRGPLELQVAKAWTMATTVGDYHFERGSEVLNEAGRRHVQWILFESPRHRRSIYVAADVDPEITETRMQSVRDWVAQLTGSTEAVPMSVTFTTPRLSPGLDVDVSQRLHYQSFPLPRLPGVVSQTTGASAPSGLPGSP